MTPIEKIQNRIEIIRLEIKELDEDQTVTAEMKTLLYDLLNNRLKRLGEALSRIQTEEAIGGEL